MEQSMFESFALKIVDGYELARERESFLNVDEKVYYSLFFLVSILKCIVAGYGIRKVVPGSVTASILWLSFVNSCICDWEAQGWILNFAFFAATSSLLFMFSDAKFPLFFCVAVWTVACMDRAFHFTLDFYVIATALSFIARQHSKNVEEAFLLISILFYIDWICDQFIESMNLSHSLAMLYFPFLLLTSFQKFENREVRFACVAVYGYFWFLHKLVNIDYVRCDGASCSEKLIVLLEKLDHFLGIVDFRKFMNSTRTLAN